jgi:hypothetical protein
MRQRVRRAANLETLVAVAREQVPHSPRVKLSRDAQGAERLGPLPVCDTAKNGPGLASSRRNKHVKARA